MHSNNGLVSKVQSGNNPVNPGEISRREFLTGLATIAGLGIPSGACTTTTPSPSPTAYASTPTDSKVDAVSKSNVPNLDGRVFYLYRDSPENEGTEYVIRQDGSNFKIQLLKAPMFSKKARTQIQAEGEISGKTDSEGKMPLKGTYYIALFDRPIHDHWSQLQNSYLTLDWTGKYTLFLQARSRIRGSYHWSTLVEK